MASEALEKAGLHFDDLNRIRVLDEDTSSQVGSQKGISLNIDYNVQWILLIQAQELKEVCQDFLGDIGDFQVSAHAIIGIAW